MDSSLLRALAFLVVLGSPAFSSRGAEADPQATEREQGVALKFKEFDRDGDGKLAGRELNRPKWLRLLDANGDGEVTLPEAQERIALAAKIGLHQEMMPVSATPPPAFEATDSPREGPSILKPAEYGVGTLVSDVVFRDLDGKAQRLSEYASGHPLVVALTSPTCPVSKRYGPTLAALQKQFESRGVRFLAVAPTETDTPEQLRAFLTGVGLQAVCTLDSEHTLARALGALSTTDVFLLDSARTLVYRGAIDDQYGLGYSLEAPLRRFLADALEAVLAQTTPLIAATSAPGCLLDLPKSPAPLETTLTYHNRVSRILQANCVECHRTGGVAPFPLENYEQVAAKAGMIRRMVERRLMPPWFAAPLDKTGHSPWINDRSLAERDRADLLAWIEAGKAQGDLREAAAPRRWPGEWQIGTPDAVLQIPAPIEVKATGVMPYQEVYVETGYTEDKWLRGYEIQPTAREVVHHVLIFAQPGGPAPKGDGEDGRSYFAAYVPGNNHIVYADGMAKRLPAGSRLKFQIHYTPNGTATRDQIRIGLLFAKNRPAHEIQSTAVADFRLRIPPGAENHAETGIIPVPMNVKVLGFMPHMHVRGKAFRYEVILPGGETRTLLDIPRYDFNWQLAYRYAEPPTIPAGSKVRGTAWYDNSANNPANPDPTKSVRWGPQTSDEMMLGYIEYYQITPGT